MRLRLLPGTLCAAAAFLAACSSQPPVGPLGNGGTGGQQCMVGHTGQPLTLGIYELQNKGTT